MNWFLDPVKNHYADFKGVATRKEFWLFQMGLVFISLLIMIAENQLKTTVIGWIYSIATLLPVISIGARRLHDTGRSGWWQLIGLIPVLGWIAFIFLMSLPSAKLENKYLKVTT